MQRSMQCAQNTGIWHHLTMWAFLVLYETPMKLIGKTGGGGGGGGEMFLYHHSYISPWSLIEKSDNKCIIGKNEITVTMRK